MTEIVHETKNYIVYPVHHDDDMAEDIGGREAAEGAYHVKNKETDVVEFKTVVLPQAIMAADQYQEVLDQKSGDDSANDASIVDASSRFTAIQGGRDDGDE